MTWATSRRRQALPGDWRRRRARVLARDGHRCVWCGSHEQLEVDHLGHRDEHRLDNLRALCARCHVQRTARQAAAARAPRATRARPDERRAGQP
jgi:5-methylcytosine-specific restriction endonuclease McrA